MRLILSAYVGPMPRPVVPMLFLPRNRSVTLSIVVWYDVIRWAFDDSDHGRGVHAAGGQAVDLVEQHPRVDDHAVGDHRDAARGQHARGQQVGGELLAVDHDGVAGIVSALIADAIIDGRPQQVRRLALALVAPLGSEHHDRGHLAPLYVGSASVPTVLAKHATSPDAQQHRGSCEATLSEVNGVAEASTAVGGVVDGYSPARGADAADHELRGRQRRRAATRAGARGAAGGHRCRGGQDHEPGRARRRAPPPRRPPDRGRRRRRQPARGDRRAAPPSRADRHRRGTGAAGHRQRLRPRHRHPARPGGGGRGGGDRGGPAGRPDRRLPRRGGREQRPHRRRRPGLAQRASRSRR